MSNLVTRRLEILRMEGSGFNRAEIVRHVSEKFGVSPRSVYRDFQRRSEWQPGLMQLGDRKALAWKLLSRYEHVYREAAFARLQSSNEYTRVGNLKVMLEANDKLFEKLVLLDVARDVDEIKQHLGMKP